MSRHHQRSGTRPIYTNARASEAPFQLELPGEAGLAPPPRAEDPVETAWIIEPRPGEAGQQPQAEERRGDRRQAERRGTEPSPPAPTTSGAATTELPPTEIPLSQGQAATAVSPPEQKTPEQAPVAPAEAAGARPTTELVMPTDNAAPTPQAVVTPPTQIMMQGPPIDEQMLAAIASKAAQMLGDAERERLQMMEKARTEAGKMMEGARQEKEAVLAAASAEAEKLRTEAAALKAAAHQTGHQEGLAAGQSDAKAAAYAQMEEKVGELLQAIKNITDAALADRQQSIDDMEPELVTLAVEIAEKILTQELGLNPDAIIGITRSCLQRVRDRQEIVIHANSADMETLQRYRDQFIRLEDLSGLRIVEDSRVGSGGILLETAGGEIDARMEMQLDRIRNEFQTVLEADQPAPAWPEA